MGSLGVFCFFWVVYLFGDFFLFFGLGVRGRSFSVSEGFFLLFEEKEFVGNGRFLWELFFFFVFLDVVFESRVKICVRIRLEIGVE